MFKIYTNKTGHKYEVHSNGDIYSCERKTSGAVAGVVARKKLKQFESAKGYLFVNLGSKERNVSCHRLVAKMFIENNDNKQEVNHINGITNDNRVENLEWVTRSENIIHSYAQLERKPILKTTEEQRNDIIKKRKEGATYKELANEYSLGYNTIRRIINGKDYKTVCKSAYN